MMTSDRDRGRARLLPIVAALACGACAARQPPPEPPSELSTETATAYSTGGQTPTTDSAESTQQRAQLEERRHDLLVRCGEARAALEAQRRSVGAVGAGVVAGVAQMAAGGAPRATQEPRESMTVPLAGSGMQDTEGARLNARIDHLRTAMRALTMADTNAEILRAIGRLQPECAEH